MVKKISFKLSILLMLTLAVVLSYKSTNALAATTKIISITVQQSFSSDSEVGPQLSEYINTHNTYNYDDGLYYGTLSISNVNLVSRTPEYPNSTIYRYIFSITYTGMTTKRPVTKNVAVTVQQSFSGTEPEINQQLGAYINSHPSYSYSEGNFNGTLSVSNVSLVSQTSQYPNLYTYIFTITYSGIATSD